MKPPFRSVRIPARDVVVIDYVKGMNEKSLNVQFAAWLYHNDYRNRIPNTLIWLDGIPQPGQEIGRIKIVVQMEKYGTVS